MARNITFTRYATIAATILLQIVMDQLIVVYRNRLIRIPARETDFRVAYESRRGIIDGEFYHTCLHERTRVSMVYILKNL